MFLKICGLRDAATAHACAQLGVSAVGLVFAEGSVRQVTAVDAAGIVAGLPEEVETVGVFTDAPLSSIIDDVRRAGLTTAQLHGPRSRDEVARLRDAGIDVILARRVGEEIEDPSVRLLIDGDAPGSGTPIAVDRLDRATLPAEWILAGGLSGANIADRIRILAPTGVDVSSGVESSRGQKSIALIEAFVAAVRGAETDAVA